MTEVEKPKHLVYAEGFGTWINRTTATLFFVLLTLKVFGVATLVPLTWWLVFAPLFVRWVFVLVCVIILGISAYVIEKNKR